MLAKFIKNHPIVGAYAQWPVSNTGRKEYMDANVMTTNLKDTVDKISSLTISAAKNIIELKTSVAYAKKAADTAISKIGSLAKKRWFSKDAGVQEGCTPEEEPVLAVKTEDGGTQGVPGDNSVDNTIEGNKGGSSI